MRGGRRQLTDIPIKGPIFAAYIGLSSAINTMAGLLGRGQSRGELTLLTSLDYLHIPICRPDHSGGGGAHEGQKERERKLLQPGTQREKVQWRAHGGRKSASDQQGLANQERQKSSQLFVLAGAGKKGSRSRWCSLVPAVLQRRRRKKWKMTMKESCLIWGHFAFLLPFFSFFPPTSDFYCFCPSLLFINIPGKHEYLREVFYPPPLTKNKLPHHSNERPHALFMCHFWKWSRKTALQSVKEWKDEEKIHWKSKMYRHTSRSLNVYLYQVS